MKKRKTVVNYKALYKQWAKGRPDLPKNPTHEEARRIMVAAAQKSPS